MTDPLPYPAANTQELDPKPPLEHELKCAEQTTGPQYTNWEKQSHRAFKDMTKNLTVILDYLIAGHQRLTDRIGIQLSDKRWKSCWGDTIYVDGSGATTVFDSEGTVAAWVVLNHIYGVSFGKPTSVTTNGMQHK
ncbi:hypothetical protein FRC09_005532, partial [Ceratobasidium sp. 395]